MILPKHVYVRDGEVPYDPIGGSQALNNIIMRYYKDDISKQNEAFKIYSDFREKSGVHFGGRYLDHIARTGTADDFWAWTSLADKTCRRQLRYEIVSFSQLCDVFYLFVHSLRFSLTTVAVN